eukprot:4443171-Pyramimonas_sp.AAC.3
MATEELPGIPEYPEFAEEASRQMEEDELSHGMIFPVPPASRSSRVTQAPFQRTALDDAPHGTQSRNEVMRRRVENADGNAGRISDSSRSQLPKQRTHFLRPCAGPEHKDRA